MVDWHDAYRLKVQPVAHTEREAEGPGHLDHIGNSKGPSTCKDNELILNNLKRNTHLPQIPNHTPGTTTPAVPKHHSPVSDLSHLTIFRKKRKERKTEKKKEKEKSAAFSAHGVVDVKVLRGKILFWA